MVSGALVPACGGLTYLAAPYVDLPEPRFVLRDRRATTRHSGLPSPLRASAPTSARTRTRAVHHHRGRASHALVWAATLDAYDALTYNVSNGSTEGLLDFVRVGARIDDPTPGQLLDLNVQIGDYTGVWLPNVGATRDRFDGPHARST